MDNFPRYCQQKTFDLGNILGNGTLKFDPLPTMSETVQKTCSFEELLNSGTQFDRVSTSKDLFPRTQRKKKKSFFGLWKCLGSSSGEETKNKSSHKSKRKKWFKSSKQSKTLPHYLGKVEKLQNLVGSKRSQKKFSSCNNQKLDALRPHTLEVDRIKTLGR